MYDYLCIVETVPVWQPGSVLGPLFVRRDLVKNFRCLYPVEPVHLEAFTILSLTMAFRGVHGVNVLGMTHYLNSKVIITL